MSNDPEIRVRRVRRALGVCGALFALCVTGLYLSLGPALAALGVPAPASVPVGLRQASVVVVAAAGVVGLPWLAVTLLWLVWGRDRRHAREMELKARDLELTIRDKELKVREAELRVLEGRQRSQEAQARAGRVAPPRGPGRW